MLVFGGVHSLLLLVQWLVHPVPRQCKVMLSKLESEEDSKKMTGIMGLANKQAIHGVFAQVNID